ncbi:GntR family transcriptional regulator [Devosia sp. A8/3-2]|nr:GntR family transcriptional regulator [Devosia sp. A8/3-2]
MLETNEETIALRVVRALRDEIVTMALRPGDVISESDIAGRYGVSRQPVREAFICPGAAGAAADPAQAGHSGQENLARWSAAIALHPRIHRGGNHPAGGGQSGQGCPAVLNGLIADREKASAANDRAAFHTLDELFHRTLARLAGVEYAWQLIDDHKIQLDRVRYLTLGVSSSQRAIAEHKEIAAAVGKADVAAAEQAMREHLGRAEALLTQTIGDFPDYFE